MTPSEQLARYRSKHKIAPFEWLLPSYPQGMRCQTDQIRIHGRRSKGRDLYLHDADEIKRLVRAAAREGWTEPELREAYGR